MPTSLGKDVADVAETALHSAEEVKTEPGGAVGSLFLGIWAIESILMLVLVFCWAYTVSEHNDAVNVRRQLMTSINALAPDQRQLTASKLVAEYDEGYGQDGTYKALSMTSSPIDHAGDGAADKSAVRASLMAVANSGQQLVLDTTYEQTPWMNFLGIYLGGVGLTLGVLVAAERLG